MTNSADPDQLASEEANWSESTLFAKQGIFRFSRTMVKQELRQAGHYTPGASNKMQHINWLLYNSVLRI